MRPTSTTCARCLHFSHGTSDSNENAEGRDSPLPLEEGPRPPLNFPVYLSVSSPSRIGLLLGREGLDVPDHLCVLVDAAVAAEEAHAGDGGDALCQPVLLVAVGVVDELLGLDVRGEVVRDEVVVAVVDDAVDERAEAARVAEGAGLDRLEHGRQLRVKLVASVKVGVAQLVDVLGKVAEEEDVVLANLAGDFDLSNEGQLAF